LQRTWTVDDVSVTFDGAGKHRYPVNGVGKDPKVGNFLILSDY
jgi:hypothetical protein